MPQYLDDNGNPISDAPKTYLDDNGEPIGGDQKSAPDFTPPQTGISRFLSGSWRDPLTRIEPHQPVHSASDLGREVVRGVGNIGAGGLGMLLRPVATVEGMGTALRHPLDTAKAFSEQAQANPLETAESFIGQAGATAGVGELGGAAMRGVGRAIPKVARAVSGTGPKVVGDLVKETQSENAASAAKAGEAKAVEAKRGGLQKDIQEKSRELQGRIETARNNALKEGNQKYNAVNEKLNAQPANRDAIQAAVAEAAEKIKGSGTEPAILKSVASRLDKGDYVYQGGQKFGPGTPLYESVKASEGGIPGGASKPFSYEDLQGYYSELGAELSKGTLPGDVYTALDTLHEAIGNEMQRIADTKGLGPQLTEARNYWRKMKQTFGRPTAVRDNATRTLNSLSPEFAKQEKTGNAVRMLGDYDPEIPKRAGEVTEARKGLKSLPKAKPTDAVKKTIGETDVRAAKAESLGKRADTIEHRGSWVAAWPLFHVMSSIMRGEIPSVGGIAMESAGTYGAVRGISGILRNPKVVEFLTKATPKDVEQIPADLRGQFPSIVQAAQKGGIRISPALKAIAGGAAVAGQRKKSVAAALDIGTSEGNPGTPPQ